MGNRRGRAAKPGGSRVADISAMLFAIAALITAVAGLVTAAHAAAG
jgi:ABC-type xylose transport system permease subunit